ncbi:MAG TPA: efflux RND transporter periplasmic adaptor subunit [Planctomycetaceae bacterium]|nr:efflux RND transporter periplasmic adaptor subunit [Planctomycetaceae bacterium]
MQRRAAIATIVLVAAGWTVWTVDRSDAFQPPGRADRTRPAAGAQPQPSPARAEAAPRAADSPASAGAAERSVPVERSRIMLIDQRVLASEVPGIVAEVPFREGDEVAAGALVARLRDDVPKAALATAQKLAEADIEKRYAEAAFEVADKMVEAAQRSNERFARSVPLMELERLQLDSHRADLQIEKSDFDRELNELRAGEAEAQLNAYTITAPFDGVVTRVERKVGEAVRQGDPILELVSTRRVRVEGEVDVRHAWEIKRGNPVRVQIGRTAVVEDLPAQRNGRAFDSARVPGVQPRHLEIPADIRDRVFEGRVVYVDPTVHPIVLTVRVWAEVENPDGILKSGLPAQMTINPDGE